MPLTSDYRVSETPTGFKAIPEDDYQCVITDVNTRETFKYKSNEKETQLVFTLLVVEGEHKARKLWFYCRPVFSPGAPGRNPSKLFDFLKAIYGFPGYQKDVHQLDSIVYSAGGLNTLVGKQLIITVQNYRKADGVEANKIGFMKKIKSEVEVDPAFLLPDEPDASSEPTKNNKIMSEGVGLEDEMPF